MNASSWNSFDQMFDQPPTTQKPKKRRKIKKKEPISTPEQEKKERTAFTLTSLPVTSNVSEEDFRELMEAAPTPSIKNPQTNTPQVVAEQLYFNRQNSDFWQRDDLSHLRPYDFPYIRSMVQQAPQDTLSPEDTRHKETARAKIEVVTREYEEKNLREPVGDERPCIMAENCQGMQLPHVKEQKFVLKEFLLPTENEEAKRTRTWPKEGRLCILCKRAEIARAFINIRADGMGVKQNMILQDYRNIVNIPGEYRLDDCILSSATIFQGLLDPVVLHIKSAYRVKTINGVRHLDQWRMKYPEHEQSFRGGTRQ
tara:strand:- start:86 stop:1021 length:936 start_codon:yes stop_codon:yes gene_type:complete